MATTTLTAILDGYSALLKALTPTTLTTRRFDRVMPDADLEKLASGDPTWIRRFDWSVEDAGEVPGLYSPTVCERERSVDLLVVYPSSAPRLYGTDASAMQRTMEADLLQLSDCLESPSHYVSGQNVGRVSSTTYEEQPGYTMTRITLRLHYYETRSIG